MSVLPGENIRHSSDLLTVSSVIDVCEIQAAAPQDNDQYIQAFAQSAAQLLRQPGLGVTLTYALDMRSIDMPSPAAMFNLMRCAFQKQLLRLDPDNYPQNGYDKPEKWDQAINWITSNSDRSDELLSDLVCRRVQTNIGDRYKAHKIIMLSLQERLGPQPRFLDIGCSELQGPKQLHFPKLVPFLPVDVAPSDRTDAHAANNRQQRVNNLIADDDFTPGATVGVDPVALSSTNAEWIVACTFKPAEIAQRDRQAAFNALHKLKSRNIFGYWQDFSNRGMKDFLSAPFQAHTPLDKFEVITFTTVLNQVNPQRVVHMRDLARSYMTDNGIIIYQDRVASHPLHKHRLQFLPDFNNYNYRTSIEFAEDPTHTLFEVMQWETGRCKKMRPGPYFDKLLQA